jgi:DNA-binding NtrC family response regulator
MIKILAIEENPKWRERLKEFLLPQNDISFWPNGKDLASFLRQEHFDIVLLNIQLQKADSFTVLYQIRQISFHTPIIVTSEIEEASLIVKACKNGAFDFIVKPYSKEKIEYPLNAVWKTRALKMKLTILNANRTLFTILSGSSLIARP